MNLIERATRATEYPWAPLIWGTVTAGSLFVAIMFFGAPVAIYVPGLIVFSTIYLLVAGRGNRGLGQPRR